jgi:hypothetical protein
MLTIKRSNQKIHVAGSGMIMIVALCFGFGCQTTTNESPSAVSLPLDEKIVEWVEKRSEIMVKHRTSCEDMAQALYQHHLDHLDQEKKWKAIRQQMDIDQKMLFDQLFGKRLKAALEKSKIVYEYCADHPDILSLPKRGE